MTHPSAETVSDLVEGLLQPEDAATVEAHLAGCAECHDLRDALSDVRALLGDLPSPRIPADVADRLDAALAGSPALSREPDEDGPARSDGPSLQSSAPVDLTARRKRRRVLTGVGAAAASLVLVVLGGLVVLQGVQPASQGESGAVQETRSAPESAAKRTQGESPQSLYAPDAPEYVTSSGTAYSARSLAAQVERLLADRLRRDSAFAARPPKPVAGFVLPRNLESCLAGLAPAGPRPLVVDLGSYAGKPAAVVVLPRDRDEVDAWVVGPGCDVHDPHVLDRKRVSRP